MNTWLLCALLLLNLALAAPQPWEQAEMPWALLQPSADLAFLLCVVCLAVQLLPAPRAIAGAGALLTLFLPLYRFGETLLPAFYGKPFEPWVDILELPGLVHLLTHRYPAGVQAAMFAGAGLGAAAWLWLAWRLWRPVTAACAQPRLAFACLLATQALFGASFLLEASTAGRASLLRPSMLRAAVDDLASTLRTPRWHGDAVVRERVQAAATELARTPRDLGRLLGADVYLLVLESYGRGILDHGARAQFESWLHEYGTPLTNSGWQAASGWIAPSVRGGGSSLAHAELLSGVPVEDRRVLDALLASPVRTLAAIARDAGYHTVDAQPALPRPWPEAKALGFDTHLLQADFGYTGREYHWGLMPDQYALQHLLATVVARRTQPVFLQYVAVTSHAPFSILPPYHDDWSRAADPTAYETPEAEWDIGWTTYASHPRVEEAYLATIRYSLRTALGFTRQLQAPSLVLIVGDHQPPLAYRDRADRLHDVPLHVLGNRPGLLEPILGAGLAPGLVPPAEASSFPASRFLFRFLRAYGKNSG
jgi:hypothetical protein